MSTTLVRLTCNHTMMFAEHTPPPRIGDTVYCLRCNGVSDVADAPDEYRVRCRVCTWGKSFGCAGLRAGIEAAKHANRKGHAVRIYNGAAMIRTVGEYTERALFPPPGSPPPF